MWTTLSGLQHWTMVQTHLLGRSLCLAPVSFLSLAGAEPMLNACRTTSYPREPSFSTAVPVHWFMAASTLRLNTLAEALPTGAEYGCGTSVSGPVSALRTPR